MKNILNLIVLLFFFITISCKENHSVNRDPIASKDNALDSLEKNIEFKQIILKCSGDDYSAKKCISEKDKVAISFLEKTISITIKDIVFKANIENSGELGYQMYLYGSPQNNKVIIFDTFLENGHLFYTYFYDNTSIKYLGKKEVIINEESSILENIRINKNKNELIISFGNSITDLKFNIDKSINSDNTSNISISEIMEKNKSNPEEVTNHLIFTKDRNNKLQINTEILSYIQKNTTAQQNQYTLALEKYVTHEIIKFYDDKNSPWTEEELIKIIAFASNTTDPLHKKFWKESPDNWHNGMWGNILSFCYLVYPETLWIKLQNQLKKESYYNLPYLKEMISYASEFDKFGPP
ncbi:hypothetical protein [Chryseobacterium lactis]|uniref:hypothetical protein n=1 Tax=Chryseobacterium lactis TaxID=1241981 RepID=UPI000F505603|nr:hypothetical protein [Chryseobacterium lactis]